MIVFMLLEINVDISTRLFSSQEQQTQQEYYNVFNKQIHNHNPQSRGNIKKYRKRSGISQDKLSKRADVAYNTSIKIILGACINQTIERLPKTANVLGASVDGLTK
jgi:hypothetical protein